MARWKSSRWWWRWRASAPSDRLGARGERLAARFLRRQGMTVVGRNERYGRAEIDLVAVERGRTVVFVEVKTRTGRPPDDPAEGVDDDKQRHVTRAALAYLRRHHLLECPVRFDVVTVLLAAGRRPEIQHYRAAFEAEGFDSQWG